MQFKKWIEEDYAEAVRLLPDIPEELRRALKAHERIPVFFENLNRELFKMSLKHKMDRQTVKQLVYDMTNFFCINVRRMCDERVMSDIAKTVAQRKADEFKDLEATADGKISGEYTELIKEVQDGGDQAPKEGPENRQPDGKAE